MYSPDAAGTYPVIFFVSGFGGNAPVSTYKTWMEGTASAGYIVVGVDKVRAPNYIDHSNSVGDMIHMMKGGDLDDLLVGFGAPARADMNKVALMGQSAGCHTVSQTLQMYKGVCHDWVKGLVLVDPVDGADPFGLDNTQDVIYAETNDDGFYTRIDKLNYAIPTLYVAAGEDPSVNIGVACAPREIALDRFFYAAQGPIWGFNATLMGHADCLDGPMDDVADFLCPTSADPNTPGKRAEDFRTLLVDKTVAFLNGIMHGKIATMRTELETMSEFTSIVTDIELYRDTNGHNVDVDFGGCRMYNIMDNCQTRLKDNGSGQMCVMNKWKLSNPLTWGQGCKSGTFEHEPCTDDGVPGTATEMCCPNGYTLPTLPPVTSPTPPPTTPAPPPPTYSPTSPTGSPVGSPVNSPVASPVASPVSSPVASPVASPAASPVASPAATPTSGSGGGNTGAQTTDSTGQVAGVIGGVAVVAAALGGVIYMKRSTARREEMMEMNKQTPYMASAAPPQQHVAGYSQHTQMTAHSSFPAV